MLNLGKKKRTIAMATAALALAGVTALGTSNTASAATKVDASASPATSQGCLEQIGQEGVYGWQGTSVAGYVEQLYNTCDGTLGVEWTWDTNWAAAHYGSYVDLYLSSPDGNYGSPFTTGVLTRVYTWDGWDTWWGTNLDHGAAKPNDDWRAGAQINNDNCWQWGTLHWYGGQDWGGPVGGCGAAYADAPPAWS